MKQKLGVCPILLHAIMTSGNTKDAMKRAQCLGEQCQFWSPVVDECALILPHLKEPERRFRLVPDD